MLKQHSNIFSFIFVALDFFILAFSYPLARYLVYGQSDLGCLFFFIYFSSGKNITDFIILYTIIFIFFILLEKFEFSSTFRIRTISNIVTNIIKFEMLLLSVFYVSKLIGIYSYNEKTLLYYILITTLFFLIERITIKLVLNFIRKRGYNYKNYLIIGAGKLGIDFYEAVTKNFELGIKIIGFLDDKREVDDLISSEKIKEMILNETSQIENILKTMPIDNVIVTLPMTVEKKIIEITNICEKYGIKTELIPNYRKIVSSNPSLRIIENFPLIGIRNIPLENMFNRLIKRLLDLLLAIPGIILISPMLIIVMVIIKLTSKGPIFFKQRRTGLKQKEFNIIKFRTMKVNNESDIRQATKDDPRKTKFGEFLRRTNIDELPQIINVIKGEMSIVGPRPHMIAHTNKFYQEYDKYMVRHLVKPGITGLAQVNGWRGDSDIGTRVKYDIKYIENWSIWLDLKIIFLTFFGKKTKKNAV